MRSISMKFATAVLSSVARCTFGRRSGAVALRVNLLEKGLKKFGDDARSLILEKHVFVPAGNALDEQPAFHEICPAHIRVGEGGDNLIALKQHDVALGRSDFIIAACCFERIEEEPATPV